MAEPKITKAFGFPEHLARRLEQVAQSSGLTQTDIVLNAVVVELERMKSKTAKKAEQIFD